MNRHSKRRRRPLAAYKRLLVGGWFLFGFLAFLLAVTLYIRLWWGNQWSALLVTLIFFTVATSLWFAMAVILGVERQAVKPADVIVVLGYPTREDGQPSHNMRYRVKEGVFLYREGYAPRLLFSGGAAYNQFVEAEVMAELAVEMGVDRSDILLEPYSLSTKENVYLVAEMMRERGWQSAIVVTNYYNTRRVRFFMNDEGLDVVAVPAPRSPSLAAWVVGSVGLTLWLFYRLTAGSSIV